MPKNGAHVIFPIEDGTVKLSGRDQVFRKSTSMWRYPERGEEHKDFQGESDGSQPLPKITDDSEGPIDFWPLDGNFINRHHVEPRVKLYVPKEESLPIPMRFIDVVMRK